MYHALASLPAQTDLIHVAVGAWAAFAIFIVASWVSAIIWAWRDISARTDDPFVRWLSLAPVTVFSIAGLLPYVLMRPQETAEQRLQRQLDMETCRRELDQYVVCPRCRRRTQPDFVACPYCRETVARACEACGKQVALSWLVCPYCAATQPQSPSPAAFRRREVQLATRASARPARPQVNPR